MHIQIAGTDTPMYPCLRSQAYQSARGLLKDLAGFGEKAEFKLGARSSSDLRYVHTRLRTIHAGHESNCSD